MSAIVEKARERVEEVRAKGVLSTLQEIRGGSTGNPNSNSPIISEIREKGALAVLKERFPKIGGGGGSSELPAIKDIREKGVLTVLGQKFPRVKEIREKGLLARESSGSTPSPASHSPPVIEEKDIKVRGAKVVT